jgi:hypothetical protein
MALIEEQERILADKIKIIEAKYALLLAPINKKQQDAMIALHTETQAVMKDRLAEINAEKAK